MSRKDSKVWESFMNSPFAQEQIGKMEKQAQVDRSKLYNVDPKNKTELNKSVETMGVSGGGGSMVGSGDSKALYTMKKAPTPGGAEEYADTVVEGLEDIASAMMEVAMREPKGGPFGSQDNSPEKWDGLQAAGKKNVKSFTKQAHELELHGEEGSDLESLLADLSKEDEADEAHEAHEGHEHALELAGDEDSELESILADLDKVASTKRASMNMLKELVKIANDLDLAGEHADAAEIDSVLKEEVKALIASKKK